jgi:hypothetical protein
LAVGATKQETNAMKTSRSGGMPKVSGSFGKAKRASNSPGMAPMAPPGLARRMLAPAKLPKMMRKGGKVCKR